METEESEHRQVNPENDHDPTQMSDRNLFKELLLCGGKYNKFWAQCDECEIRCGYFKEWARRGRPAPNLSKGRKR